MDDINFVRVDILENWRFWNQFRSEPEKAGLAAIAIADALLSQDMGNEHAARLLKEAFEFRAKKQESGRIGGLRKSENQRKKDKPSTVGPKDGQQTYGKFANVYLTSEQHSELARAIGGFNELKALIDSLSCALEDGSRTSGNHYATLQHWIDYRKEHPAENPNHYETVSEHNRRVSEKASREIAEMCRK